MSNIQSQQRIVRLTPLDQALAALDSVLPVAAREIATGAALGRTLALDAVASPCPAQALALRDGWAVRSELTSDANSYSPALLPAMPARVDVGEPLPLDTDAVAPLEALLVRQQQAEALAPVGAGDGVLPPGGDVSDGTVLRRAGERLQAIDIAVLIAAGIGPVSVREPWIKIVRAGAADAVIDAAVGLVARAVESGGGCSEVKIADTPDTLAENLRDSAPDAFITIGGTGTGRHDASVTTLCRIGQVDFHGVGLAPGETLAFGRIDTRPALLLPGRLDSALAGWLLFGLPRTGRFSRCRACARQQQRRPRVDPAEGQRLAGWLLFGLPLLAKLCKSVDQENMALVLELSRKVTSTIGIAEIVPVRRHGETLEPLASGYLPLSSLVSDGWILIPPESEGHPAGTPVAMRAWP
jgi:molybdopterin biosynthesis enzyme